MKLNTIEYSAKENDFIVNGVPLQCHLEKHERIAPKDYLPSVVCQPGACDRLAGVSPPDLGETHVAIYLCGHCGEYDGNPIGAKVSFDGDVVKWTEMGFYIEEVEAIEPLKKVREFKFSLDDYSKFVENARISQI